MVARQGRGRLTAPPSASKLSGIGFERFEAGDQVYAVTRLDLRAGHAPVWWVRIAADFNGWTVSTGRSGTIEEPS